MILISDMYSGQLGNDRLNTLVGGRLDIVNDVQLFEYLVLE